MRRRILRLRRFHWRWTLAFTRKSPESEQASVVKHLDCSRKPGGFRVFRPQMTWGYAWLRVSTALSHKLWLELSDDLLGRQLTYRLMPQPVDHLAVHLRQRHPPAVRPRGKKAGGDDHAGAALAAVATP